MQNEVRQKLEKTSVLNQMGSSLHGADGEEEAFLREILNDLRGEN